MMNEPPTYDYSGRNTVWGFRDRVIKNLRFVEAARQTGADVHIVTELITSLLGLIVFPYEEIRRQGYSNFKDFSLSNLAASGWPQWGFHVGGSEDLNDLVRHLRNAISHRRIYFSSDSRKPRDVEVRFHDMEDRKSKQHFRSAAATTRLRRQPLLARGAGSAPGTRRQHAAAHSKAWHG